MDRLGHRIGEQFLGDTGALLGVEFALDEVDRSVVDRFGCLGVIDGREGSCGGMAARILATGGGADFESVDRGLGWGGHGVTAFQGVWRDTD